ncbi:hypothetical protein [Niallia sp. FSL R7-0271]|uniref:hypothetical protein n=1 Tax=Niallia sp. FSL R7-0271 TaxID=2921678 RepID=UPI0030F59178
MYTTIYLVNFSFYKIMEDNVKLIDTHVNQQATENKESLESLLRLLGFEFIGNDDLWGVRTDNIIIIAEISQKKSRANKHYPFQPL